MTEKARVTAHNGLRLRDSPRDGVTLEVIPENDEIEILGRETWLRVQHGDQTGFVLADYVERLDAAASAVVKPVPQAPVISVSPSASEVITIEEFGPSPVFQGEPIRIDVNEQDGFVASVKGIESLAGQLGLTVFVTSSLREPYKPVAGAIVTPAQFSNHHVGHALDVNLILDGRFFRSDKLAQFASLPEPIRVFLDMARAKLGMRWGGDFSPPDPVHLDDGLNVRQQQLFNKKLRALWGPPPS
jgi:hypothetical protein